MWLLLACAGAPADDPEEAGLRGLALLQEGKPAEAIPHLRRAAELAPDDDRAWQALAVGLRQAGQVQGVAEACGHLVPAESAARTQLACARGLAATGDRAASPWFDAAMKIEGADKLALREEKAEAAVAAGALEVAADEFRRLARAHPAGAQQDRLEARGDEVRAQIPKGAPAADAPNVVLFVLDTVRADHLGAYRYDAARTPNIDRLAATGVVFEDAQSQAPWTSASIGSLMSGLYPSVHGLDKGAGWGMKKKTGDLPFLIAKSVGPDHVMLAERLRRQGYSTAGFVSNTYVNATFGLAQGFEIYGDDHADYTLVSKRRGETTTADVLEWLEDAPEPFFLFVHYNDAHWPYDPLPPFDEGTKGYTGELTPETTHLVVETMGEKNEDLSEEDLAYLIALYDGEIAYVDHQVGQVMEALATHTDRPLVTVLTSDHGEEFLDHGGTSHGYTLFQEQIHVPLILSGEGLPTSTRVSGAVRTLDIPSTVLDLLGEGPLGQGQSLLPMLDGGPGPDVVGAEATYNTAQRAIRAGDMKRIEVLDGGAQVFDLAADPDERKDLGDDPELAATSAAWVEENARVRGALGDLESEVVLDETTSKALEALGYIE